VASVCTWNSETAQVTIMGWVGGQRRNALRMAMLLLHLYHAFERVTEVTPREGRCTRLHERGTKETLRVQKKRPKQRKDGA